MRKSILLIIINVLLILTFISCKQSATISPSSTSKTTPKNTVSKVTCTPTKEEQISPSPSSDVTTSSTFSPTVLPTNTHNSNSNTVYKVTSKCVLSDEKYTFFTDSKGDVNVIYRMNNNDTKVIEYLNVVGRIIQLFLDKNGYLYYLYWISDPQEYDYGNCKLYLCKIVDNKEQKITTDIDKIISVEKDFIYYVNKNGIVYRMNFDTMLIEEYDNLADNNESKFFYEYSYKEYIFFAYNDNLIKYNYKTKQEEIIFSDYTYCLFTVDAKYAFVAREKSNCSYYICDVKNKESKKLNSKYRFVNPISVSYYKEFIYLVDYDENSKSIIYKYSFRDNSIKKEIKLNEITSTSTENERLYFVIRDNKSTFKIQYLNMITSKIINYATFKNIRIDEGWLPVFFRVDKYLWIYNYINTSEGEFLYECKIIAP